MVNEMTFSGNLEDEMLLGRRVPTQRDAGVNPVSGRGEDQARDEFMRELEDQPSRPLSSEEKRAAETDAGRAPSVYAPASERVPEEPLPGDRQIVDHLDTSTAERSAVYAQEEIVSTTTAAAPGDPPSHETSTSNGPRYG